MKTGALLEEVLHRYEGHSKANELRMPIRPSTHVRAQTALFMYVILSEESRSNEIGTPCIVARPDYFRHIRRDAHFLYVLRARPFRDISWASHGISTGVSRDSYGYRPPPKSLEKRIGDPRTNINLWITRERLVAGPWETLGPDPWVTHVPHGPPL